MTIKTNTKARINTIKIHLTNNKKTYITGATCLVVGAVGALALTCRGNTAVIDSYKLINWKSPHTSNTVQITIPKPGNSGNMIYCALNDTYYPSQRSTAKALDLSEGNLSRHLRGDLSHVKGFTFDKVAENGVALAK